MSLSTFLQKLQNTPEQIEFNEVIELIDIMYDFSPTPFNNGDIQNQAGENNGSCKLFAFGQLQNLSKAQMLACFGHYYRDDVLQHPEKDDHQNIRQFIRYGWDGIEYQGQALQAK